MNVSVNDGKDLKTMKNENNEFVYIHSLKLADRLVNAGFKCEGKKVNVQNPQYCDFIFKNIEGVGEIIDQYCLERRAAKESLNNT